MVDDRYEAGELEGDDEVTVSDLPRVPGWRVDRAGRFFALAIGWTWIALGIAWVSGATATEPPASGLRLVAGIGPAIAAIVLVHRSEYRDGRRRFWSRVVDVESVGWRWWLIIAAASAGPGLAAWIVSSQHDLGVSGAAGVGGVMVFAAAAALAEEPGWRGYALDALRDRFWSAALMISVVWAVWHLPLYAIEGTFQHDDVGFGTAFFWIIQAALLPQTILMIWIIDHTRPSIAPAVVFHALVNISGEVFEYSTAQQALRLGLWVLLATIVIGRRSSPRTQPGGDEHERQRGERKGGRRRDGNTGAAAPRSKHSESGQPIRRLVGRRPHRHRYRRDARRRRSVVMSLLQCSESHNDWTTTRVSPQSPRHA